MILNTSSLRMRMVSVQHAFDIGAHTLFRKLATSTTWGSLACGTSMVSSARATGRHHVNSHRTTSDKYEAATRSMAWAITARARCSPQRQERRKPFRCWSMGLLPMYSPGRAPGRSCAAQQSSSEIIGYADSPDARHPPPPLLILPLILTVWRSIRSTLAHFPQSPPKSTLISLTSELSINIVICHYGRHQKNPQRGILGSAYDHRPPADSRL